MHLKLLIFSSIFALLLHSQSGYALHCLKCHDTDVSGDCRLGKRVFRPKLQVCNGKNAQCYATATLDAEGNASFDRGCTIKDLCGDDAPEGLQYCKTCKSIHCNFEAMDVEYEDF